MKTALVVIDVQHGLCTGEYAMFEADEIIHRINALSAKARAEKVPVIFIQHDEAGGPLQHGTAGWQLAEGLVALESDFYIRKTAADAFHRTELDAALRQLAVDSLVICGMQSDYCVDTTTRRALALGYQVVLVADGHTTMDNEVLPAAQISRHHTLTLANLNNFGPSIRAMAAREVTFSP